MLYMSDTKSLYRYKQDALVSHLNYKWIKISYKRSEENQWSEIDYELICRLYIIVASKTPTTDDREPAIFASDIYQNTYLQFEKIPEDSYQFRLNNVNRFEWEDSELVEKKVWVLEINDDDHNFMGLGWESVEFKVLSKEEITKMFDECNLKL